MLKHYAANLSGVVVNFAVFAILSWVQSAAISGWSHWELLAHDHPIGSILDAGIFFAAILASAFLVERISRVTNGSLVLLTLSSLVLLLIILGTPGDASEDNLVMHAFWNGLTGTAGGVVAIVWWKRRKLKHPGSHKG